MDVLYFLKDRTRFIRKFYDVAEGTFAATKRKISDSEPPFDEPPPGFNPEHGEPPFLEEYMEADDGQEFVGQSCVSFLAGSIKLFFDEMRQDLTRYHGGKLSTFGVKYAQKHGWFAANKKWFADVGIDFEKSGADLAIVEEVAITRNSAQHQQSITSKNISLRGKQVKRPPFPWFVHEFERHGVDPESLADLERFSWMLSITREKFVRAIDEVDRLCEYIWRRSRGEEQAPTDEE
jgi:hypothetical protein